MFNFNQIVLGFNPDLEKEIEQTVNTPFDCWNSVLVKIDEVCLIAEPKIPEASFTRELGKWNEVKKHNSNVCAMKTRITSWDFC